MRGLLDRRAEGDRLLIEHLFWNEGTEGEVAGQLGISQPAISKRKRVILNLGAIQKLFPSFH
jgi:hypothetical protein